MSRPIHTVAVTLALLTFAGTAAAQPRGAMSGTAAESEAVDALALALARRPGGVTPDEAARAASRTSYAVREKQSDLRAAAAKVDQALVGYFPRVSLTATYTRLSSVENTLSADGALVVARREGPITTGPCPSNPGITCALDSSGGPIAAQALSFDMPSINNQYSFVASLSVPVSDYLLRITQAHASASRSASAKRLEVEVQALQTEVDARIAYYNWVRAKGQVVVARQSVDQAKAHELDASRLFEASMVSKADVLRLEAQVASAQKFEAEAHAFASVAELQLRTMMHAPDDARLEIGIDVLGTTRAPITESFDHLEREALANRPELRVFDETHAAQREALAVTRAGYLPRVDAFANGTLANPNQREFPAKERWSFTWEAGARLSWTLNDTFTTAGASAEGRARAQAILDKKGSFRDALRVEVGNAYAEVKKAEVTVDAARRGLASAEEAMRVQRELFRTGKANAVSLVDAEAELTRARLNRIDAHVGREVARTRLDHATGRDAARRARR
jgi:outer membrane protein TolC